MYCVIITPAPRGCPDLVHISNLLTSERTIIAGRPDAIEWLWQQGCCPGAAFMLHGAILWHPHIIAEPSDVSSPSRWYLDTT